MNTLNITGRRSVTCAWPVAALGLEVHAATAHHGVKAVQALGLCNLVDDANAGRVRREISLGRPNEINRLRRVIDRVGRLSRNGSAARNLLYEKRSESTARLTLGHALGSAGSHVHQSMVVTKRCCCRC
jgi:hypothetical protein